jgi:pilus assembly protein Flp/PilA
MRPKVLQGKVAMQVMAQRLIDWNRSEEGQDLVEYGLLTSLISVFAIATIVLVGPYLQTMFAHIVSALNLT